MSAEQKQSILIVDDDEVYRNRLARAFVDRGYDVRTAHDHDSAVAIASEDSPELAVVDLKMPGKSGLEVLMSGTDKSLVGLELDIFWASVAGQNPVDLLKRYSGRVRRYTKFEGTIKRSPT